MNDRDAAGASAEPHRAREPLPSTSLFVACALHAAPLAWAAWVLPAESPSWFLLTIGSLALLHAVVAGLALGKRERALSLAWRILSIYSLLLLLGLTWVIGSSALYLSELYRGIGRAVSAALFGIWGVLVLLTVPISCWGIARTLPFARARRARMAARAAAAGALTLALAGSLSIGRAARAEPVIARDRAEVEQLLARIAKAHTAVGADRARARVSLLHLAPSVCDAPIDPARQTLLLTGIDRDRVPFGACVQAADPQTLERALDRLLVERAEPGRALAVELVTGVHALPRVHPLLDALSVRPARDGVCSGRACLAPWQLVARDAFTRYRPLDAVPDASFGVSLDELAAALGDARLRGAPLTRIETRSFLLHDAQVVPFVRQQRAHIASDDAALTRAVALASAHIVASQQPDGAFRYVLRPFTGEVETSELSLPRQAGTTLALCELGPERTSRVVAARALAQLATYERRVGALSAISDSTVLAPLGQSALPLIAFSACRNWSSGEQDALIGRLARLLLAMQRADGSFYPELDLLSGEPMGEHAALYAAGQAVFALVLVEQLASAAPSPLLPKPAELARAVELAMDHYARDYWPKPLRSLFYLEENWHCLAARAALGSHRHDDYERFCLDYVNFKARLILSQQETSDPEHVGGYGLSSMFPPHSTATAGFAESLAAAIDIKRARGLPLQHDRALMKSVLGFVLRQQWTRESCFACAPGAEAVGGFSESSASSAIRIDYVQHAMAALGHGARALAKTER
jgi:hypothetical protein